jgi:hypothetical protein
MCYKFPNKAYTAFAVYGLLIMLPLGIISMILSLTGVNCNHTDPVGVSVTQYLLAISISQIVIGLSLIFPSVSPDSSTISSYIIFFLIVVCTYDIILFVIGITVIIQSNLNCFDGNNSVIIYALAVLIHIPIQTIINIVNIIVKYRDNHNSDDNNNNNNIHDYTVL